MMARTNIARGLAIAVVGATVAAAAPLLDRGADWGSVANALCLLVAAGSLAFAVGEGGLPSLAHGAFVGTGAYATAALRVSRGWDPVTASATAIALTGVLGLFVARSFARLRPTFVVLATWLVAWTFAMAVDAFPTVLGGSAGVSIGSTSFRSRALGRTIVIQPIGWYEIALALAVMTAVAAVGARRRYRPALAFARADASAARAAGVAVDRLRQQVMVSSAVAAGAAGCLLVQIAGVADPTRYGPILSVKLLVVVVLGGTETLLGPAVGLGAFSVVDHISSALAHALGPRTPTMEPLVTGVVLLVVIVVARGGITAALARRFAARRHTRDEHVPREHEHRPSFAGAPIEIRDVSVSFGGIEALRALTLDIEPGTVHAIIGPNGSGKTTLLRVLDGTIAATRGAAITPPKTVRVLPRLDDAPGLSVLDAVVAGMERVRSTGWLAAMTMTPLHRVEARHCDREAERWLHAAQVTTAPTEQLETASLANRHLVQVARALACEPHAVLLDEPSAGMDHEGEQRLVHVINAMREAGLTIVLVDHNFHLVGQVADAVTVLAAGEIVASGPPQRIAALPVVHELYLGDMAASL